MSKFRYKFVHEVVQRTDYRGSLICIAFILFLKENVKHNMQAQSLVTCHFFTTYSCILIICRKNKEQTPHVPIFTKKCKFTICICQLQLSMPFVNKVKDIIH